jgi:hypothetical protein
MKIKRDHKEGCSCAICKWRDSGLSQDEAMAKYADWEDEQLKKHGWIVHFIGSDDPATPTGVNYHTHGLTDAFNHLDLQVVISLGQNTAHGIFKSAIDQIKEGRKFAHGDVVDRIVKGYNVKFVTATEGGRNLLRIILPDQNGSLDYADMEVGMREQYDDLEE